jgi:hypothetical protein
VLYVLGGLRTCYKASGSNPTLNLTLCPATMPCAGIYVKTAPNTSVTSVYIGSGGTNKTSGNLGLYTALANPKYLTLASNGDLFWTEYATCMVRKMRASDGIVASVAGSTCGYADGAGTAAQFGNMSGIAWSPAGKRRASYISGPDGLDACSWGWCSYDWEADPKAVALTYAVTVVSCC